MDPWPADRRFKALTRLLVLALVLMLPVQAWAGLVMPLRAIVATEGVDDARDAMPPCHGSQPVAADVAPASDRSTDASDVSTASSDQGGSCERCTLCHMAGASMPGTVWPALPNGWRPVWHAATVLDPVSTRPPPAEHPPRT
ncbi:MAG: hypothetical protein MUF30_07875 [Burkholderiales bacterium]|jgi:hypothetical protein|nr:hypothetical protein [Burkholderiales bacterium]